MLRFKTRAGAIAGAITTAVFAGTGAAIAAGVAVNEPNLGATSVTADCQTGTITPTWGITYDSSIPGYRITSVELAGIESGCLNKSVKVVLANSSGVELTSTTGTTPGSGTTASIAVSPGYDLSGTWPSQLVVIIYS